jgi:four helix bundle protein
VICRTGIAFFAASSRPIDGNSFDVWHSQAGITRVLNGISFAPVVLMTRPELEARSMEFAVAVKELCDELRVQPIAWNTASQLLDASTSMAANYRATARSRSRAEWIAKLGGVVEESDEAVHWLEFIVASKMAQPQRIETLLMEAKELRAIFAAAAATSRRNARRGRKDQ